MKKFQCIDINKLGTYKYQLLNYDEIFRNFKNYNSVYKLNCDLHKSAFLNWRFEFEDEVDSGFNILGESFMETAGYLLENAMNFNSDHKADSMIFPILFNIFQGLELYLKSIREKLNILIKNEEPLSKKGHNIIGLIEDLQGKLKQLKKISGNRYNKNIDELFQELEVVSKIVKNLLPEEDEDVFFVRYSVKNRNNERYFYNKRNNTNIYVDLEELYKQYSILYSIIDTMDQSVKLIMDDLIDYNNN